jgi:hypothetical protein
VSPSDCSDDTGVEVDEVGDLSGSEVNLDSVVDFDSRIGVADPIILQYAIIRQRSEPV